MPRRLKHVIDLPTYQRESQLLTVREVARMVGVSYNTIYAMLAAEGEYLGIRPLRVSPREVRFPRAAVEAVLRGERDVAAS